MIFLIYIFNLYFYNCEYSSKCINDFTKHELSLESFIALLKMLLGFLSFGILTLLMNDYTWLATMRAFF